MIIPQAPILSAKSYLLMDFQSGKILAEQNIDTKVEPASLTKMMTIYVVDQELKSGKLKLDDKLMVSHKAWKMQGSRMFLKVNTEVTVDELIKGVIIQSGNDASIVLAEHIAGSEESFSQIMNYYAKQLGMNNTHFVNATGMPDPNHYTTARDLSLLAQALIRDFPDSYAVHAEKYYTYMNIKQPNRNRLLWRNELVDGIKTGHTDSAGFCLVASAKKEDMRLIAVVMGNKNDESRTSEANKLLNFGFRFFETHKLFSEGNPIQIERIWMGKSKNIHLGVLEDTYITIAQGHHEFISSSIEIEDILKAPIQANTIIGKIKVKDKEELIAEFPLYALETIEKGSFISRCYDYIALSIKKVWDKALN